MNPQNGQIAAALPERSYRSDSRVGQGSARGHVYIGVCIR